MSRPLPRIFTTDDAFAAGYTLAQIRYRVAIQRWVVLHRGLYCTAETLTETQGDPRAAHLLYVAAAQRALGAPSWASHESAARLLGLPVRPGPLAEVTLTQPPGRQRPRSYAGVSVHVAGIPAPDQTSVDGCPTLTAGRTVVDLARGYGLADALVIGDAALYLGLTTQPELHAVLDRCVGWPGSAAARAAVEHMDGRRETPIESRSWVMFLRGGLPLPEPQVWILDENGWPLARVDFLWRAQRVIGEADGAVKYAGGLDADGRSPLLREKLRQEALEGLGYRVVRWDWLGTTRRADQTVARIGRALALGDARRLGA